MMFIKSALFAFIATFFFTLGFASPVPIAQPEARGVTNDNLSAQKVELVRVYKKRQDVEINKALLISPTKSVGGVISSFPRGLDSETAEEATLSPFEKRELKFKRQERVNTVPAEIATQSLNGFIEPFDGGN